jgi:hypothetical protein
MSGQMCWLSPKDTDGKKYCTLGLIPTNPGALTQLASNLRSLTILSQEALLGGQPLRN